MIRMIRSGLSALLKSPQKGLVPNSLQVSKPLQMVIPPPVWVTKVPCADSSYAAMGRRLFYKLITQPSVKMVTSIRRGEHELNMVDTPGHTDFGGEEPNTLPDSVDWRQQGAVTRVRSQGKADTCYAFAVVAAVESINYIKRKELVTLSVQQIIDCNSMTTGCGGCGGGIMSHVFEYIIACGGLVSEEDYPYAGVEGVCDLSIALKERVTITGYNYLPIDDEDALLAAVARQPVIVGIDARHYSFVSYTGGVYKGPCGKNIDHALTIVGYGEEGGVKFWIAKNSYGDDWGEGGYIRMVRGVGICGIPLYATYPLKCD